MSGDAAREAVWSAVHAALDARRVPLDDPAVLAALEAAPAELAEVAALGAGLRALPAAARAAPPLRRPRFLALAAAAAAAAVLFAWWPRDRGAPTAVAPTASAPVAPAAESGETAPAAHAAEAASGSVLFASASSARTVTLPASGGVLDHRQSFTISRP